MSLFLLGITDTRCRIFDNNLMAQKVLKKARKLDNLRPMDVLES